MKLCKKVNNLLKKIFKLYIMLLFHLPQKLIIVDGHGNRDSQEIRINVIAKDDPEQVVS